MSKQLNESGYILLISVLIMGAVALSIATSISLLGIGASRSSFAEQQGYQSEALGDACGEIAAANLKANSNYAGGTFTIGSGQCVISIAQPCPSSVCTVNATGTMGSVTRRTQITATTAGGGGSLILGKGSFPISPATLTYTAAGSTGGITVRDDAVTPNRPVNENFQIATSTQPIIHSTSNQVNVGDVVTLSGNSFNASSAANTLTCNCSEVPVSTYCATLTFGGVVNPNPNPNLGTTGSFSGYSYTIPAVPFGRQNLTGIDPGLIKVPPPPTCNNQRTSLSQVFFVSPKITATACSGTPKTTVISGTGFAASSTITIIWDNADTTVNATTDSSGSFSSTNFTIPLTGTHKLSARDASRNFAANLTYSCAF